MNECVYTRAECHHQGTKCSECPLTDLICDEFTDCLDLSYQQGKADAIEEVMKMAKFNIHFENVAEEERFMWMCEQMQEGAENELD